MFDAGGDDSWEINVQLAGGMLLCDMVDVPVELVVAMSMRALMVDWLRLSTASINIEATDDGSYSY